MMRISIGLAAVGLAAFLTTAASGAIHFSVARLSPIVSPGGVTPADVVMSTDSGVRVVIPGRLLGLLTTFDGTSYEGDDLNALSFGRDAIAGQLNFAVDNLSRGLPGTPINQRAEGDGGVGGDIYLALPDSNSHAVLIPAMDLGLTSLSSVGDNVNGFSMSDPTQRVYFSIDQDSASNGFGGGGLAGTIFLNDLNHVFASAVDHIGLDPQDDIDALLLWDVFEPGVLNPGFDLALFSISRDSPNAITMGGNYSSADVLFTDFRGTFLVGVPAARIGLADTDDLNGLSAASDTVPEPGTLSCWVLAAGGMLACGRWRRGR